MLLLMSRVLCFVSVWSATYCNGHGGELVKLLLVESVRSGFESTRASKEQRLVRETVISHWYCSFLFTKRSPRTFASFIMFKLLQVAYGTTRLAQLKDCIYDKKLDKVTCSSTYLNIM